MDLVYPVWNRNQHRWGFWECARCGVAVAHLGQDRNPSIGNMLRRRFAYTAHRHFLVIMILAFSVGRLHIRFDFLVVVFFCGMHHHIHHSAALLLD